MGKKENRRDRFCEDGPQGHPYLYLQALHLQELRVLI
jgi:hypothetical protein